MLALINQTTWHYSQDQCENIKFTIAYLKCPRKGWREEVERDLQVMRVRRWRKLMIDREKWRDTV
jgi:hypothetical protein